MKLRILARLLFAGALVAGVEGCDDDDGLAPPGNDGAIVTFAFDATDDTMDVLVLDSATIAIARQRVETGAGPRMPIGPIVRGAGVDPDFPFHYIPAAVRLNDLAMEICDGRPMRTVQEVYDFFELSTGNRNAVEATWCPWGARPIAVRNR
jgi:hypothetical protein